MKKIKIKNLPAGISEYDVILFMAEKVLEPKSKHDIISPGLWSPFFFNKNLLFLIKRHVGFNYIIVYDFFTKKIVSSSKSERYYDNSTIYEEITGVIIDNIADVTLSKIAQVAILSRTGVKKNVTLFLHIPD